MNNYQTYAINGRMTKCNIYVHGCTTCGIYAHLIDLVKRDYPDAVVYNTRYEDDAKVRQLELLNNAGFEKDTYTAIVELEDRVVRLGEWSLLKSA